MHDKLSTLSPSERATRSEMIRHALKERSEVLQAKTILVFAGLKGEPDLLPLARQWQSGGLVVTLPRVMSARLVPWSHPFQKGELRPGPLGNMEPWAGEPVDPGLLDICLIPGLAFSVQGARLGRGGGHFDRFLSGIRARFWGICFGFQILEHVPSETLDIPMHALVTEEGFTNCRP